MQTVNLQSSDLFGKLAAEDEDESIFNSYLVKRPELPRIVSHRKDDNLVVVSAFKGEGKSALLRMGMKELKARKEVFISRTTASSISIDKSSPDVAVLAKMWKASIYNYVAREVGARIGFAWQDDSIGLVEFAQKEGLKSKPLLVALFDRFKLQVPGLAQVDRKHESLGPAAEETVKRWADQKQGFWFFIDDVDAHFKDTKESRAKLMAFFQAIREIRNEAPAIRIRATVRPNIWAILRSDFPDAGKLNDYRVDLNWTEEQLRDILAARISAYLRRHQQRVEETAARKIVGICFEDPMQWGSEKRPPYVILNTLSRSRPRWMLEICKAAAVAAAGNQKIGLDHIVSVLGEVGKERRQDLAIEYEPQCKQLDEIIGIFHGGDEEYTTKQLFVLLEEALAKGLKVEIVGAGGTGNTPRTIARLLYELGFLTAKQPGRSGYTHISFAENPSLIPLSGPVAEKIVWEIPPIFRQSLGIRDTWGKKIRPRSH